MNYSIAIIVPSTEVSATAKEAIQTLHLDYPVIAASSEKAVEEAKKLIPLGLRLIITHGITYQHLLNQVHIPLLELPFGGLDAMATVKQALAVGGRIIHMGTKPFYKFIRRSLEQLDMDPERIIFYELNMEQTIDEQVLTMLSYNFDVFIGGYPVVYAAQKAGKTGIEFNVSPEIIQTTVKNAQTIVKMLVQLEENQAMDKAILQSSSDGLIVTNEQDDILFINPAALSIFRCNEEELTGMNIYLAFKEYHIIDSQNISDSKQLESSEYTPVVLKQVPITLNETTAGTVISIKRVSEVHELEYQIRETLIAKGFIARHTFQDIIGKSPVLRAAKEKAGIYAKYDSTILIYGETGTGKELFAQSIHNASQRRNQPFIAVNCAALPDNLIESELFGYVKGAFTGASAKGKPGLFEQADKGTIFLDEISEIPVSLQSKLLRVLQEGDIIRIGGDKVIHVDTRIICSSNKDLLKLVAEGRFKSDLYYRLSTLEVNIPPLRDRKEDIPPLAQALLYKYSRKHNKPVFSLAPEVIDYLSRMDFPGNVRQLENFIERMVILSDSSVVDAATMEKCDLPVLKEAVRPSCEPDDIDSMAHAKDSMPFQKNLKNLQLEMIQEALEKCNGNKTAAARLLGIHPSTLWRQLKKL